jgi:hypothetical protein
MPVWLFVLILIIAVTGIVFTALAPRYLLRRYVRISVIVFLSIIAVLSIIYILLSAGLIAV